MSDTERPEGEGTEVEQLGDAAPAVEEPGIKKRRGGPGSINPNMAGDEQARLRAMRHPEPQLDEQLAALRDHILAAFPDLGVEAFRGELTLIVQPERVPELLRFCRDDADVRCEILADLSGVHWPGGTRVEAAAETTGWPTYETEDVGRFEIDYIVRSITHNHAFRVRTAVPDDEGARIASVTDLYKSAMFMEREVYDMFGVDFVDHPDLRRILMPEEWVGHPHRKDYPLGGVEVQYKEATIPPPDQRSY